jgi:3-hydroxyacyl-CoA dehydrogenase / enoyl-CoA hydratase / 3-hydroxybutyryl-CoA epimerase
VGNPRQGRRQHQHAVGSGLTRAGGIARRGPCRRPTALVIRSAKPNGFIAGAEIHELAGLTDAAVIEDKIAAGLGVLDALEAFPKPTIALIHGFCLGGGLELALACRYRLATPDAKLGFPEVMLGLFPGLGGTWRSLSRMKQVDAMTAMLTGRSLIARKAKAQGLVDAVTEERHFAEAVRWAAAGKLSRSKPKGVIDRAMALAPVRRLVATRMEKEAAKKAPRVHYPAPYALIDLWRELGEDTKGWRSRGRDTRAFAQLLQGGTSRNLVRCFFLREKLKGLAKGHDHAIGHVHVVGAGVMGGDIAALCALRGFRVSLQDREIRFIAPAMKRANAMFAKRLFTEADRRAALDRLMPDPAGWVWPGPIWSSRRCPRIWRSSRRSTGPARPACAPMPFLPPTPPRSSSSRCTRA